MDNPFPESIEELSPHDHVCLFHKDAKDRLAALAPYFRSGLSRGEKCVLLCGAEDGEELLAGLGGKGIDVGAALSRGSILVEPALPQDLRLRPGKSRGEIDPRPVGKAR